MASTIASGKGKGDTGSGNNWAAKHAQLASQGQLYIPEYQNLGMVSAMPPAVGVPQGPSQGKRPRVEDTFPDNKATSRAKRKRTSQAAVTMTLSKDNAIDPTVKLAPPDVPKPPKKGSKKAEIATPEKRLRRVRKQPPKSFLERLDRATTQRMFVIDRNRGGTNEEPEETFQIAGTTGNIYSITIGKLPSCTCPDNEKGNQCKHIIYALHHILKAPEHLEYQLALTSLELREIFEHAPFVPISKVSSDGKSSDRKPVEGLCPICYIDYDIATDEIVWCKAACGNNVHRECFQQYANSLRGKQLRCIFCRTPWESDEKTIQEAAQKSTVRSEGYVNIASELGISGLRDTSTYHPIWARQQSWWNGIR